MGSNRKMILVLMLLLISVCMVGCKPDEPDYCEKIVSAMNNKETITAGDIFSFEFDRAYILNDPYMSGETFEDLYDLGLSIKEVKNGRIDYVQRIVFVDEDGSFVYEFQCTWEELLIHEPGIIFYPETIIKMSDQDDPSVVCFDSSDRYGSKYVYLDH